MSWNTDHEDLDLPLKHYAFGAKSKSAIALNAINIALTGLHVYTNVITEGKMEHTTKIRAIGNSQGVTLPKAMLERYHLKEGDTVTTVETEDGILLKSHDPEFEEGMRAFNQFSGKYKNALRELAK